MGKQTQTLLTGLLKHRPAVSPARWRRSGLSNDPHMVLVKWTQAPNSLPAPKEAPGPPGCSKKDRSGGREVAVDSTSPSLYPLVDMNKKCVPETGSYWPQGPHSESRIHQTQERGALLNPSSAPPPRANREPLHPTHSHVERCSAREFRRPGCLR